MSEQDSSMYEKDNWIVPLDTSKIMSGKDYLKMVRKKTLTINVGIPTMDAYLGEPCGIVSSHSIISWNDEKIALFRNFNWSNDDGIITNAIGQSDNIYKIPLKDLLKTNPHTGRFTKPGTIVSYVDNQNPSLNRKNFSSRFSETACIQVSKIIIQLESGTIDDYPGMKNLFDDYPYTTIYIK